MKTFEFLSYLHSLDVKLWAEGDQLRCNAPDGVLTPVLQDELKNRKAEILTLLRSIDENGDYKLLPIECVERKGPLPLSFAQQRLWFLHQMEPESPAYNSPLVLRLKGPVDLSALRQALQALVDRHETLRTCFPNVKGQPAQVITDSLVLPWDQQDLRELPEADREANAQERIQSLARQPFDLATGPLISTHLLQLAEADFVLLLNLHHIISDGWSMGVVSRELTALYEAFVHHQPSPLPPLPIQYVDFAHWQRQWLTGEVLDQQLTYWREHLAALPVLEMPTDRGRPPRQTYTGAKYAFCIEQALRDRLFTLSQKAGVTVAITLLAAFQLLLARYTGQTDIVVGSPIANRNRREIEGLIGFFVNSLVMRTDLSGDPTFHELLKRVQQVALAAYDHQDLPFEQLVDDLQPERDPSRNPLFQVMFAVQNAPAEAFTLPGVTVQPFGGETTTTTRFDLEGHIWERDKRLQGLLIYNTDLFDAVTMERFSRHFQRVLEEVVRDPAQRLSQISLMDEAERRQLLVDWNATETVYPRAATLAERFEAQVAATPDAVALVFEEQQLTYAELNSRANHLAQYLHHQYGVGPEVCVGLCMERSIEMVTGLLGILKAGGAYLPLDPSAPVGRLAFMLKDADIVLVLTQDTLQAQLPGEWAGPVIALDSEWAAIAQTPASNVRSGVTAENLAYIMYTSGSTGQPKGITIPQYAVIRLVLETNYIDLTATDRVAQTATSSFDAATFELWGALLNGGRLIIIPKTIALSPQYLAGHLQHCGVTTMFLTTALFNQMAREAPAAFRGLRHLLFGGEAVDPRWVTEVLQAAPHQRLLHVYGPTENTTFTTWHLTETVSPGETTVPIGRPIANTQVYVLDPAMQPVPVGVYGELYIGGDGLARNYLRRPTLTAEKFVPHPFSLEPGARLYKTGDMVRYRSDGALEFQGRRDHQVKVRGYRIELGEIEAVLTQHPAIAESVALVREDEPGEKRLVAYVVAAEAALSVSDLRQHLKQHVPEYMVPAHLVMLDALPLTPNGKVDRKKLPIPEGGRGGLETEYIAPQTPTQLKLAEIWSDVLNVERVGVHDNFFELGGHSLLATQVVSQVYQAFEVELSLQKFFDAPTVAGIADFLSSAAAAGEAVTRPQLVPVSREGQLPLSFAQERLWLLEQLEPGSTAYSMPSAFRLSGSLNVSALEQSLVQLLQRHETLRTSYAVVNERPVQVIASAESFSLPVIDLQDHPPDEQESAVRQQIETVHSRPFDLVQGPLFRASLLRLAPEESVLVLVLHHSIADGLSMNILYRELAAGYAVACRGEAWHQPPLPVQYADYAVWQRQWLQGAALDSLLRYWTDQLAGGPPQLMLPTDFPRPPVQTHRGAHHAVQVPASVVASLRALSQAEGVTMFMSMLAAFVLVLSRHAGQQDVVVGTPVANRLRPELEAMIGLFLNTLVLRTNLSEDPTLRELLQRVRDVCLGAYAHQELPFERLVEELQPERDLSRTPLFQVFFNLVDVSETTLTLPGLTVSPLPGAHETTKFDLTLYVFLSGEGATVQWSYNSDLFDASTIVWMAEQYQTALRHLYEVPDAPISSVSLLQEVDRARLMAPPDPVCPTQAFVAVPETAVAQSIPARFEEQVQQKPEQLAVHTPQHQWTYEELNRRANQIAHTLLLQKFPADTRVALLCAHDAPMVAAILGVLKAGYTYVPLDPSFPPTRLQTMAADAGVQAVLAESAYLSLAHTLGEAAGRVFKMDEALAGANAGNPQHPVSPDTLAYVLYTSGTTGVPKGVMQSHRHVLHHIRVYTNNLHLHPGDRLTLLASYGFDAAVQDMFGALLNGATLYPFDLKEADPAALWLWMKQHAITVYHATPTVYRYWIDARQGAPTLPALRLIVLGGEVATWGDFAAYQRHFGPSCLFVNGLGPTESTVSLQFVADHKTKIIGQTVPVGHAVEHTEITLLDQDGKETEVYGEIAIRSPYVAVGYWQQPELTRRAFEAPSEPGGARLYRTGDMGRRRSDGSLEFMGRKDTQVKIRGYRIELGEIETALAQHQLVRKAVVVHRDDGPAGPYLVGYLLTSRDTSISPEELRSFLSERLPAYMVPSAWVELDAFPLTPNGKVDRKALPAPDRNLSQPAEAPVAPRDEIEVQLTEIWERVLGVENIGMEDNFFDLGGHSLLAVRLFTAVQKVFGRDLPMTTLFQAPTIGQLAGIIRQEGFTTPWSSLAPIQAGGSKPPFFCVHGCTGRILHLYDLGRFLGPEQPFYGLSASGFEKGQVLHTQIEEMAAHYIKEIRTIQSNGPYFIGGTGYGCTIVLEMAHQLKSQGQDIGLMVFLTPSPLKPNVTHTNLDTYGRLLRKFDIYGRLLRHYYRLLIVHLKSRPLIPALYRAFSNRVLWHFRIFHRFIPVDIYRWRRFIYVFSKARMSYEPKPYQGRITCLLRDEFSHNRKKGIGDWSDIAVGGLDVRFVPGNIYTMWEEPHVQILADQLKVSLDEALTDIDARRKQSTPTDVVDTEMSQNTLATPRVSNQ